MTLYLAPFIFLADISTHILTKRMTIIQDFPAPSGNISTHILTKRMTFSTLSLCNICSNISTHILTKRMTQQNNNVDVEKVFQLTSSRRGWLIRWTEKCHLSYFNSHPHEEDDCMVLSACLIQISISTHILTKRMTRNNITNTFNELFQLTSSRRGWLTFDELIFIRDVFQLTSSRRGWL